MAQKNFSIGHELKEDFEQFCTENAYTESAVMAAAFLAFTGMEHGDRVKWFSQASARWSAPVKKKAMQPIGPVRGARKKETA